MKTIIKIILLDKTTGEEIYKKSFTDESKANKFEEFVNTWFTGIEILRDEKRRKL